MILTPIIVDSVSAFLQIAGGWVSATQVILAFKGPIFGQIQPKFGPTDPPEHTDEYKRFSNKLKNIFITGLILITLGILFNLLKYTELYKG